MVRYNQHIRRSLITDKSSHSRIISIPDETPYLDTVKLNQMEQVFRKWVDDSNSVYVRTSRKRILFIFLLIRYTGAKLNEVLSLDPFKEIDFKRCEIILGKKGVHKNNRLLRKVQIPKTISEELKIAINTSLLRKYSNNVFRVDPAHVRRKFYEVAMACGFHPSLGTPEIIRKSRAVELIQSNVPLPVVQRILGHSTLNLTASYVAFSDEEIQRVAKYFIEKESSRKTSARNSFFGKIQSIQKGDIQSKIEMVTISGDRITTIITNDSLTKLGLRTGALIIAEIKAPWVILQRSDKEPQSTAENRFWGTIARVSRGKITTEYVVKIKDGTELCSVVSTDSARQMNLKENDKVWVLFNSYSVVLHTD